jgi:hypothetical protein
MNEEVLLQIVIGRFVKQKRLNNNIFLVNKLCDGLSDIVFVRGFEMIL